MYLEKHQSMDQDVNEATAALKGLLGIGNVGGTYDKSDARSSKEAAIATAAGSKKKVPTNKSPHRRNSGSHTPGQNNNNNSNAATADGPKQNKNKKHHKQQPTKSKKKESNSNNSNNNNSTPASTKHQYRKNNQEAHHDGNKNKEPENFAWSAFQSSPDASKLPIPAFSSPPNSGRSVVDSESIQNLFQSGNAGTDRELPDIANAPRAEDIEDALIAEAKRQQQEKQASKLEHVTELPSSPPPPQPQKKEETEDPLSHAPVSKTGVNLAAAISSKKSAPPESSAPSPPVSSPTQPTQIPPPIPAAATTATTTTTTSRPYLPQSQHQHQLELQQQQQQPYPQHLPYNLYYHHQQQQQQQQSYMAPPGYITIQVQVPMQLMPGRQMLVSTPTGYPVQVVVPEGIPGGAIIPVHVPIQPMHHMMAPQQQSYYPRPNPPRWTSNDVWGEGKKKHYGNGRNCWIGLNEGGSPGDWSVHRRGSKGRGVGLFFK